MTPVEFEAELKRMGFSKTRITAGVSRLWRHPLIGTLYLVDAAYNSEDGRAAYIRNLKRRLGLTPPLTDRPSAAADD